jgi:23S rRNA pseudouridine1911/1915/1917 synthase
MREYRVPLRASGQRADIFIAGKYPDYSRSSLTRLFDIGKVRSGKKAIKPGQRLKPRQRLLVNDELLYQKPPDIDLPVLYEDDDVLVINKPAGILTHAKGAINDEATVASFMAGKITDKNLTGNRAGIVHRLDRATSGLIIAAKNAKAQAYLQKQFASRQTQKTYLAVIEGRLEPEEAVIDAPIARNPRRPQTFMVKAEGKPAQTAYKILKRFNKGGKEYSYLEIRPITGRTHQIRVHLKYVGHPVVGDFIYGRDGQLLLHARSLKIRLPVGEQKSFTAPPSKNLSDFIKEDR